jgi:hypothetical protein
MTKLSKLLIALCAIFVMALAAAATSNAAIATSAINYGPYTIPAGNGNPHDHAGMGEINNQLTLNVAKPCTGCTITGFKANLVYANGSTANWDTGAILHHTVLMASGTGRSDTMCPGGYGGQAGSGALERIFASGNERTPVDLSASTYGVKVGSSDQFHIVAELMNYFTTAQTVYVQITYTYATGTDSTAKKAVTPLWFDEVPCGNSEFDNPFGYSDTALDITAPVSGAIVGVAGHLHDHSANLQLRDITRNQSLCTSLPGFGETPAYIDTQGKKRISSMTLCPNAGYIAQGDNLRLNARYYIPQGHTHALMGNMGIMIAYVDKTAPAVSLTGAPTVTITSPADGSESTNLSPSLAFTTTGSPTSVTCKLDRNAAAACVSPVSYTVADGVHTLQVTATNANGSRTAVTTFTVDTLAPTFVFESPAPGAVIASSNVDVEYMVNDAHVTTNTCTLDGSPVVCADEIQSFTGLANGNHVFAVSAVDPYGHASSGSLAFTVNVPTTPAPTVTISSPADNAWVKSTSATVAFSTTDATTTTCTLDAAAAAACSGSVSYSGLAQGAHTVTVSVSNSAGSASDVVPFKVDSVLPALSVTSPASGATIRSTTVTVNFTASDANGVTTTCKLDSGATAACTSPKTYTGVPRTSHTLVVIATDPAGNSTTVTRTFRTR